MEKRKKNVTELDSNYMDQYNVYIDRQKRKRERLYRRLIVLAIVAFLATGSLTVYHIKQRAIHAEKAEEHVVLVEQLAQLKHEEESLTEEIGLLNDEEYILEIARTNYFFSKEGELIFKIPDESPAY